MSQIIRTFHLAGRCIGCGECERVCPMNLPLMKLSRKLEKDAKELFDYESGKDPKSKPLLTTFRPEDPQGFILQVCVHGYAASEERFVKRFSLRAVL